MLEHLAEKFSIQRDFLSKQSNRPPLMNGVGRKSIRSFAGLRISALSW